MARDLDFSKQGKARVWLLTAVGTLFCIAAAFAIDSYSFDTGQWRWGAKPINNIVIPLVLAPPFFFFLLSKLRELSLAHHELMTVAATDSLTLCLNRRAFTALVDAYLDKITRQQTPANGALLVLDVDHFKTVNDNFGHEAGDEALKLIAGTIRSSVRELDLVGRLGGEEFGIFLPGVDPARTVIAADRIRLAVSLMDFRPQGQSCPLSVSIGGATFANGASFTELYRRADARLYAAKHAGRDRVDIEPTSLLAA